MAKFTVEISTDSAAFDAVSGGDWHVEIARILRDVADRVADYDEWGRVYDVNGNFVGAFFASGDAE